MALPGLSVVMSVQRVQLAMTEALQQLIEAARHSLFREDEREAQRRSFAYGNTRIENERITREMVDEQAEALRTGSVSI